jgi:cyclopropane-fatty-acyl-phospholipid synthase
MVNGKAGRRLAVFKKMLAHVHERLRLEFGFQVWDGSFVPEDYPRGGLLLAIADEGVVAAAMRRPNLHTLLNLIASGRLEIRNGTIFDLANRRPKVRTKELLRGKMLDKRLALTTALHFLFVPRGGPWPLEEIPQDRPSSGDAAENKKNVNYHYDLSNKFYSLFLDPEMGYTCGYYHDWNEDFATAQKNKFDIICRKLRLKPGETMLDMGCGWGGLMFHAARNYGVKVHGVTLAEQQYAFIREKIERLDLADRVSVELKDYAASEGTYDKVTAIEMFEHVGLANHPTFFQTVQRVLKPDGLYLHQVNTRLAKLREKDFRRKRKELKAITKYVLPGTEYDHIGMELGNFERFGFEVHDVENWREHLVLTLKHWHDRLYENREAATREVGAVTTRLWLVYLAGGALAYQRNTACLYQVLASKRRRGPSGLPPTRADLYQ